MPTYTPLLHIPQVAPTQAGKETTINTGLAILEAASNAAETVDASAGAVTMTVDSWTKFFYHAVTGNTVARIITVPATERFCVFGNGGTADITIHAAGSAGADLVIAAGKVVLAYTDGTDVTAISQSGSTLAALSDVDLTGLTDGQMLAWDAGSSTFKFVDPPASADEAIVTKTADYVLLETDTGKLFEMDKTSAITLTLPSNTTHAIGIGKRVDVAQANTGQVTIAAGGGVSLLYPAALAPKTRTQHSMLTAIKVDTDTWRIAGDLAGA